MKPQLRKDQVAATKMIRERWGQVGDQNKNTLCDLVLTSTPETVKESLVKWFTYLSTSKSVSAVPQYVADGISVWNIKYIDVLPTVYPLVMLKQGTCSVSGIITGLLELAVDGNQEGDDLIFSLFEKGRQFRFDMESSVPIDPMIKARLSDAIQKFVKKSVGTSSDLGVPQRFLRIMQLVKEEADGLDPVFIVRTHTESTVLFRWILSELMVRMFLVVDNHCKIKILSSFATHDLASNLASLSES